MAIVEVFQWVEQVFGLEPQLQKKIVGSILVLIFLWIAKAVIHRIVWKRTENVNTRYYWQKWINYLSSSIAFILIGRIWFAGIQSLATFLGFLSAGLAIALKDLVSSLAGWLYILWRKPFKVGDRIQIGDDAGDVIDISALKFSMMEIRNWVDADQSTGRIMHIPNSHVLSKVVVNFAQGFEFIWNEIPVLITFESDWKEAKSILTEISNKHTFHLSDQASEKIKAASKRFMIHYSVLTPIVYTSVKDSGVLLTMRYLIAPRSRRGSEEKIWENILEEFSKRNNIDFAYPTQRFYNNMTEGNQAG